MNAIAAYVLHALLAETLILVPWTTADGQALSLWNAIFLLVFVPIGTPIGGMKMASLLFALAYTGVILSVMWVLYRKRSFIEV